jgi:hydroxymethylbilane synthase
MAPATGLSRLAIGTRASALARWQSQWVADALQRAWPQRGLRCELRPITTQGDRTQHDGRPLPEIGGKGLFTLELEEALRRGEIDLAVHSLKDLPIDAAPGVVVGAIPTREDARDVVIARDRLALADLPRGARVGTSSLRRSAQLLAARPDLAVLPLRGNVDTRVQKALRGDYDAIVLAAAGVVRLGLTDLVTAYLPLEVMLPAPGQGALAVQCRADDPAVRAYLAPLDDAAARAAVTAERAFLQALGGGCAAPVAAYAQPAAGGGLRMEALVAAPDGSRVVRVAGQGHDPHDLGASLAQAALRQGAGALMP